MKTSFAKFWKLLLCCLCMALGLQGCVKTEHLQGVGNHASSAPKEAVIEPVIPIFDELTVQERDVAQRSTASSLPQASPPSRPSLATADVEKEARVQSKNQTKPLDLNKELKTKSGAEQHKPARRPEAQLNSTLGTQWGENRDSATKSVSAHRTTSRPLATTAFQYSDASSIQSLLGASAATQNNVLLLDGDIEMWVVGEQQTPWPVYRPRGCTSLACAHWYLAGRHGERYELIYVNHSPRTYEVVATVDGLDVISGQPGSVDNRGYLLHPGSYMVIDGFRQNDREVAAFRFSNKKRAYANNTPAGDARNIGVIGTALFEVKVTGELPEQAPQEPLNLGGRAFPADKANFATPPQYR